MTVVTLGETLKQTRRAKQLTQKQLAAGICSQSMLSAIEKGQYTPNAKLLMALCERLAISLDEISLTTNFAISRAANLNQKLADLCNRHQYQELFDFLQTDGVLDSIESDSQMQAYYYYLGISEWQLKHDSQTIETDFQLALANAHPNRSSTLTRLVTISMGVVKAQLGHQRVAEELIDQAVAGIEAAKYEENLIIIFYLAGLINFELKQYPATAGWVTKGIEFATDHNSHYMLANLYYLLARASEMQARIDVADEAHQRADIFSELFHEKPYENF